MNETLKIEMYKMERTLRIVITCMKTSEGLTADSYEYRFEGGEPRTLCLEKRHMFSNKAEVCSFVRKDIFPIFAKEFGLEKKCPEDAEIEVVECPFVTGPILANTFARILGRVLFAVATSCCFTAEAKCFDYQGVRYYYMDVGDGMAITNSTVSTLPLSAECLTLPNSIEGQDVVEIGDHGCAFDTPWIEYLNPRRIYLRLPEKIKRIRAKAFWNIGNVKGFSFGERLMKLRVYEFPETVESLNLTAFGYEDSSRDEIHRSFDYYYKYDDSKYGNSDFIFWGGVPEFPCTDPNFWDSAHEDGMFGGWPSLGRLYVAADLYEAFCDKRDNTIYGQGWGVKDVVCLSGGTPQKGFSRVLYTVNREDDGGIRWRVELSCRDDNARIYYTKDGSAPTTNETVSCHRYTGDPILLECPGSVKALAYNSECKYVKIEDVRCADGVVEKVLLDFDQVFDNSNFTIGFSCETDGAQIRYTIDNTPVTEASPMYTKPFTISETTTVRAKAFKENWFDSEEVVRTFTRLWHTNETPVIEAAAESFAKASQTVVLSCATEGATVYYTIDGSEPTVANGRAYKGPFKIYQTTVVKAIAVKDDWKDSAVASAMFTKENALGPALNLLEVMPDNDKEHPWSVVTDVTHDGVSAVRSGAVGEDESTTLKVVVYGAGRLSFWWKSACEPSVDGEYYDYAAFSNGSVEVAKLAGVTDWQQVVLDVVGTGKHTFKWTYRKDDSGYEPPDCVWIDQVQWLPQTSDYYAGHTLTTETPVPYVWLDAYGLGRSDDFETAAKAKTGKVDGAGHELTVEEEYVAGTDPTNAASRLEAYIEMNDGMPVVRWVPDLNENGTKAFGLTRFGEKRQ